MKNKNDFFSLKTLTNKNQEIFLKKKNVNNKILTLLKNQIYLNNEINKKDFENFEKNEKKIFEIKRKKQHLKIKRRLKAPFDYFETYGIKTFGWFKAMSRKPSN